MPKQGASYGAPRDVPRDMVLKGFMKMGLIKCFARKGQDMFLFHTNVPWPQLTIKREMFDSVKIEIGGRSDQPENDSDLTHAAQNQK